MSPEKNRHNLVKLDIAIALRQAIHAAELDCIVFGDGATVVVDDSTVYEPDITVTCENDVDLDATTMPNPCLLVEVLLPSTHGLDTGGLGVSKFKFDLAPMISGGVAKRISARIVGPNERSRPRPTTGTSAPRPRVGS